MNDKKIGYGSPPEATQFKPGESGNKKGRPKGSKNTYKLLDDILEQKVSIVQEGKQVKISKKTAMLLQAVNAAAKGDLKALGIIFPHILVADLKADEKSRTMEQLKIDDQTILDLFIKNNSFSKGEDDEKNN